MAIRNGFEWMPFVNTKDRACIEFLLAVLVAALVAVLRRIKRADRHGFDGIISFCAFFGLMTLPAFAGQCLPQRIQAGEAPDQAGFERLGDLAQASGQTPSAFMMGARCGRPLVHQPHPAIALVSP